jgi:hypothetical protein
MPPVEIRLKGHIDPQWSEWLGNLSIQYMDHDQTLLTGSITDQAALFGILRKIRDLNLRLISVVINDPCHLIENG